MVDILQYMAGGSGIMAGIGAAWWVKLWVQKTDRKLDSIVKLLSNVDKRLAIHESKENDWFDTRERVIVMESKVSAAHRRLDKL